MTSFHYTHAIVRGVPRSFKDALSLDAHDPINLQTAHQQHAAYEMLLGSFVDRVIFLEADEACPDCCFVEDAAFVLPPGDEPGAQPTAVVCRPGADSRKPEVPPVVACLKQLGFVESAAPDGDAPPVPRLVFVDAPATLDGGDVLCLDGRVLIGLSSRTNAEAVAQVASRLPPGWAVHGLELPPGPALHLKSLVTQLAEDTLVAADTPQGRQLLDLAASRGATAGYTVLWVPDALCSNVLRIGRGVVTQVSFERSEAKLRAFCDERGLELHKLSMSEGAKVDGALTCCSILLRLPPAPRS